MNNGKGEKDTSRNLLSYTIPIILSRTVGQVEPDKWPLVLARLRGQAQAVPGVRRGRESFDGFRQIAKKKNR